jgi:hypothetical protein
MKYSQFGCICAAALMGLAASAAGQAQTGAATELPGLVPPAVVNGAAVAAGSFRSAQMLRLVFGLQHPHITEEEQFLEALHTKGSPEFMHFLTADEWNARFSPSPRDEQAVVDWVQAQGLTVTHRFANRLLVDVEAPVSAIEAALAVKINSYAIGGRTYYSNDRNPVVPAVLGNIVHSVAGLNNIQAMKFGKHGFPESVFPAYSQGLTYAVGASGSDDGDRTKLAVDPGTTNGVLDPTALYSSDAYDATALNALGHCCNPLGGASSPPATSIAIVSSGYLSASDITGFHNTYPYLADNWQEFYIDGTPTLPDAEGTMDLEWATAMANSFGAAANTAKVYVYDGADSSPSTLTDAFNHVLSDGYARVLSTSAQIAEIAEIPQSSMDVFHGIFNSMIGQGWTVVGISGDGGATADCVTQDAVSYPGSDPDVVSAGGSYLVLSNGLFFGGETGWTGGYDLCVANDGGSGGGSSAYFTAPAYMEEPSGVFRQVPDIALNADWDDAPQNFYYQGKLQGAGGTSIVAPEVAGFFAQANAYMLYVGDFTGGCSSGEPCAPLGNGNVYLYVLGLYPSYAPHSPFYDITSGCNNNDVTEAHNLQYFCAGPGRDLVTGWGSFNFLQLAWAINAYLVGDLGAPAVNFSGPTLNKWYNTNQKVSWAIYDTSRNGKELTGVAGFSQAWDIDPGGDPVKEATPGAGNSFYSGPQFPNQTSGCLDFAGSSCSVGSGQGWHSVIVRAWDNTGYGGISSYGPIGYDTVPPQTTGQASTTNPVQITLTATDASSGVASTVYQLDGGSMTTYAGPFAVSGAGSHTLTFHSTDNAGNVESAESLNFTVGTITTTAVTSSVNPSQFQQTVTFTAAVSAASGTPAGTVTFFDGSTQLGTGTLSAGKAQFLTHTLAVGGHSITAAYTGSANFAASTSAVLTQTVGKAATTTTLTASPNPSSILHPLVTFTATVTGAFAGSANPGGTVSFQTGTKVWGKGTLNASTHKATFTISTLPEGTTSIQAVYAGDVDFNTSVSPVWKQVVQ